MIRFPNAKINLGLSIVSKRADGYHNLETIFYPISLCDSLEIVESAERRDLLHISGIKIDGNNNDNLVIKALRLVREEHEIPFLDIYLHKIIPFGAGLGGGSSDAASMLLLLNEKYDLHYTEDDLVKLASKLGADCAFFILNRPVFASGIGNEFSAVDFSLKGLFLILVKPLIHVSTPEAYSLVIPQKPKYDLLNVVNSSIENWQLQMKNDFEESVFSKYPQIEEIKKKLQNFGAIYSAMSGSGSSVFGIFKENPQIPSSSFEDCFVWQGELE